MKSKFSLIKNTVLIIYLFLCFEGYSQTLSIVNNSENLTSIPTAGQQNIPLFGFTMTPTTNVTFSNIFVSYTPNNLNENYVGGSFRLVTCPTNTFDASNFTLRSNSANGNATIEFNMNSNQYNANTTYYFFVIANARSSFNNGFPQAFTFSLNSSSNPKPFRNSSYQDVSTNNFGTISHTPSIIHAVYQWKGQQDINFHNSQNWVDLNGNNTNAVPPINSIIYIGTVAPTSNRWPVITNATNVGQIEMSAQNGTPSLTVNNSLTITGDLVFRNQGNADATFTISGSNQIFVGNDLKVGKIIESTVNNTTRTTIVNASVAGITVDRDFKIASSFLATNRINNASFNLVSGNLSIGNQFSLTNDNANNQITFSAPHQDSNLFLQGEFPVNISELGSKTFSLPKNVDYNGTGAQNIFLTDYFNLIISGNKNNETITLPSGTINISNHLVSNESNAEYVTTNSTINFNGTNQNIGKTTYGNLRLSNTGHKTLENGLTVNNNFNLVDETTSSIESLHSITVHGDLIVDENATFTIKNNGNLIQSGATNNNLGNVAILTNSTPIKRLDITLWSSPVVSQNIYSFSEDTLPNRFFSYTEASNSWSVINDVQNYQMIPGKGYGIRAPNNWNPTNPTIWTGTFSGVPNNGNITFTLTNESAGKFNLIGNPYPSTLNLESLYDENSAVIENKFYVYEHTTNPAATNETIVNYGILTLNPRLYVPATNSIYFENESVFENNPHIKIGQGFFCKAIETINETEELVLTNQMRSFNTSSPFFRTSNVVSSEQYDLFRVKITSPSNTQNQMVVGFFENANNEIDSIDSKAMGNPTIYSLIDNEKLIIQANALPFETSTIVSLGFKADLAGQYTLSTFDKRGIFENNPMIILHDLYINQYHNLSLESYTFDSEIGNFADRFKIIFYSLLDQPSIEITNNEIIVYQNEQNLFIATNALQGNKLTDISIFDLNGRKIYATTKINEANLALNKQKLPSNAFVIIKASTDDGKDFTTKVILN